MRHEIYRRAVARLQVLHPEFDAASYLASRLNKSPKAIYAYLIGDAVPCVIDEEQIFLICEYPEGYAEKARFVFAHPPFEVVLKSVPVAGKVKS